MMFRNAVILAATLGVILSISAAASAGQWSDDSGRRAAALYRAGKVAEARALLESWIADEPENVDAHLAYTQLRVLLGDREKVRKEYDLKAEEDRDNRAIQLVRISLLTKSLLQYRAFDKLLEQYPDFSRGWEEYGRILLEAYRPRDAVGVLEKAVALDPDRAKPHLYLGLAFRSRQNEGREIEQLRKAHELDPGDPLIGLELGTTLAFGGRAEEAAPILEACRGELGEDPELLSVLALVAAQRGDTEEADRLRRRTLEADPGYLDQLLYIGIQSRGTAQFQFGRRILELAAFLDSGFVEAYMQLGILFRSQGQNDDAIRVYETALRHGELNQLAWRNLGISHQQKGDLEKAEQYVRRSLEVDPDYLIGWVDLARILYQRGDRDKSAETWKKVIAMAPYGWEAKEGRHYLFYMEKGEDVPAMMDENSSWTAPDPEKARAVQENR